MRLRLDTATLVSLKMNMKLQFRNTKYEFKLLSIRFHENYSSYHRHFKILSVFKIVG